MPIRNSTPSASALGNIRMTIYGNYGIRAAATAMQDAFRRIVADGGVQNVHKDILPVEEVFSASGHGKSQGRR
ncbi:hypothetical protein [Mesorhizobium sp.]|uniref:hypothetical protein n=1 Tax=Mesorhizobium sp. TaxID=1871066 RepID=UPI00257B475B|nr:hypothetical protein [Mesorhizobium sp.]